MTLSKWQIILWWETRRVLYNLVLLVIGLLSVAGMLLLVDMVARPGDDDFTPLLGIILFAFMANFCYTLGWIIEVLSPELRASGGRAWASRMFKRGLLFSALLTTAPLLWACLYWGMNQGQAHR